MYEFFVTLTNGETFTDGPDRISAWWKLANLLEIYEDKIATIEIYYGDDWELVYSKEKKFLDTTHL